MQITLNKKRHLAIVAALLILFAGIFVFAVAPNPGHTASQLDLAPIYISGSNVGIGTASPQATLDIQSGTGYELRFSGTAGGNIYSPGQDLYFLAGPTKALRFGSNGANDQMILTNGNVGIGTTSPQAKLDVAGDAIIQGTVRVRDNLQASGLCIGSDCRTSWPSGGAGGSVSYVVGDYQEHLSPFKRMVTTTDYKKIAQINLSIRGGSIRVKFLMEANPSGSRPITCYVARNGNAVSENFCLRYTNTNYVWYVSKDISGWSPGDSVELYCAADWKCEGKTSEGTLSLPTVSLFGIYVGNPTLIEGNKLSCEEVNGKTEEKSGSAICEARGMTCVSAVTSYGVAVYCSQSFSSDGRYLPLTARCCTI